MCAMDPGGSAGAVGWKGRALIAALAAGASACDSTAVSVAPVSSIELTPDHIWVIEGERKSVTAVLREPAGRTLSDRTVQWSVAHGSVASVTDEGVVEGRSRGTTWLHAESEGVVQTAEIDVLPPPTIRLDPDSLSFETRSALGFTHSAEVVVDNAGAGSLDQLTAAIADGEPDPSSWLQFELLGEVAPTRLLVQVTGRRLAPGSYYAEIVVSSPADESGPRTVAVRMEVVSWLSWGGSVLPDASPNDANATR